MECFQFAILLVISIVIILVFEKVLHRANYWRESLTPAECGVTGVVTLDADPLSLYNFSATKDIPGFADIQHVTDYPSAIPERHKYLAKKCNETPGCVAFNSHGYLKSGIRSGSAVKTATYSSPCTVTTCGLYVRKCAEPEPIYAEFYPEKNYGISNAMGRILVPPGDYPDIDEVLGRNGVIVADGVRKFPNDAVSSIKIPYGLRVNLYQNRNYGGKSLTLEGNHPDLSNYPMVPLNTWDNSVSSFTVHYT